MPRFSPRKNGMCCCLLKDVRESGTFVSALRKEGLWVQRALEEVEGRLSLGEEGRSGSAGGRGEGTRFPVNGQSGWGGHGGGGGHQQGGVLSIPAGQGTGARVDHRLWAQLRLQKTWPSAQLGAGLPPLPIVRGEGRQLHWGVGGGTPCRALERVGC